MYNIEFNLDEGIQNFLSNIAEGNSKYEYRNALSGNTQNGLNLRLGYSCYALKINYTLGIWEKLKDESKSEWAEYIKSFQKKDSVFPSNSFIDSAMIEGYKNFSNYKKIKNLSKRTLSLLNLHDYQGVGHQLSIAVKAETKQAISTLAEAGFENHKKYLDFERNSTDIHHYIESLDWQKPWSAGAQFANLCVFTKTQLEDNDAQRGILSDKILEYLDTDTGFYFLSKKPSSSQLINGAMKVISGLNWLDIPIHYPKKIIDYCLQVKPSSEGCDLVDIIYVLYQASQQTNYRQSEIVNYVDSLCEIIFSHYYPNEGGFSYYKNKSQLYYYGLLTSKGKDVPDIHGTILLVWALAMIFSITENEKYEWKVLKP